MRISVLSDLIANQDEVQSKLDGMTGALESKNDKGETETREFTDEEAAEFEALIEQRDQIIDRVKVETAKANREIALAEARRTAGVLVEARNGRSGASDGLAGVSVEDEPMVYGTGSRFSYFADLYYTSGINHRPGSPLYEGARKRQLEWSAQVEREIHNGSQLGRAAVKQFREHYRSPQGDMSGPNGGPDWRGIYAECRDRGSVGVADRLDGAELRAITTGGGATASASGGGAAAFVTPVFTEGDYAPYIQYGRPFADETTKRPLPDYGMAVYMPQITGPAAVSVQGGNNPDGTIASNGVTETDPTQGFLTAGLVITSGQVTASQATLDRVGPNFEYDVVIWDQLSRNYCQNWDAYVLTVALFAAGSYGGSGWSGSSNQFVLTAPSGNAPGGFTGQIAKAAGYMETLEGTAMSPNRLFLLPTRWRQISAWSDGQERPVVVPQVAGAFNAWAASHGDPDLAPQGNTGFLLGGLPVFTDPNIPNYGTTSTDQALVCNTAETWTYEGDAVHRVLPQTLGGNLEVIFQQYSYGAVLQRYINAVQKIYGTGMSTITYTD